MKIETILRNHSISRCVGAVAKQPIG